MSDFETTICQFEDAYNASVNDTPDIVEARRLRDDGWDVFKAGERIEGILMLQESGKLILEARDDGWFSRELYATEARLAQALCVKGDTNWAVSTARSALAFEPRLYEGFVLGATREAEGSTGIFANNEGILGEGGLLEALASRSDQYMAIFSGRLSPVLTASGEEGDMIRARALSRRARRLARISQDPSKVLFADRDMPDRRRSQTRTDLGLLAWAATINAYAPAPAAVRRKVSQILCAR